MFSSWSPASALLAGVNNVRGNFCACCKPSALAPTLRTKSEVEALEIELAARTGALEVQLRDTGVSRPIDRVALASSPTAFARALELIERAAQEPELLSQLMPNDLAAATEPDARVEYLRGLLADLPEELIERSITDSVSHTASETRATRR